MTLDRRGRGQQKLVPTLGITESDGMCADDEWKEADRVNDGESGAL